MQVLGSIIVLILYVAEHCLCKVAFSFDRNRGTKQLCLFVSFHKLWSIPFGNLGTYILLEIFHFIYLSVSKFANHFDKDPLRIIDRPYHIRIGKHKTVVGFTKSMI